MSFKNTNKSLQILKRLEYENNSLKNGYEYIIGIDEVGRGCLAGPLVIAAVVLDIKKILKHLQKEQYINEYLYTKDSKQLSEQKRLQQKDFIYKEQIFYSIIEICNNEIDNKGIGKCIKEGFYNACHSIFKMLPKGATSMVLTDAVKIDHLAEPYKQINIIKGDSKSITIAAASIIAKTYRDNLMEALHNTTPDYSRYGFYNNKGYGTKQHLEALKQHGYSDIHRKSYEPIKSMINSDNK